MTEMFHFQIEGVHSFRLQIVRRASLDWFSMRFYQFSLVWVQIFHLMWAWKWLVSDLIKKSVMKTIMTHLHKQEPPIPLVMDKFSYISLWNKLYISPYHTRIWKNTVYYLYLWSWCCIAACFEPSQVFWSWTFDLKANLSVSLRHSAPRSVSCELLLSVSGWTPPSRIALLVKHRNEKNGLTWHHRWTRDDSSANRPCSQPQRVCRDPKLQSQGWTGV